MTSDRQIAANRRNAQRSTGPRTPEGRATSARNATRHGAFSQTVVTSGEDPAAFNDLLNGLTEDFDPQTTIECTLVQRIAMIIWRERRLARAEMQQINQEARNIFEVSRQGYENISLSIGDQLLVGRYQTMITNQLSAALKDLFTIQSLRAGEDETPLIEGGSNE